MALPLEGLRVLDLSRALAGPFCTMILGDLGADVVKIEPLPQGEMIRGWGPFDRDISVYFLSVNRNKRSLALNFRGPQALELLRDMAVKADVVVENFKPGVMAEMGLDYESLRARNPRLVYAGITAMGTEGPYGTWPGVDQIAQGMSGLMSITGTKESGPMRVGVPIGDLVAGMWAALGVQAALIERGKSGQGQRVDTSLLAGLIGLLCVQGQRALSLGQVPGPVGNDHPVICPYGTFMAKDGPFNMAAATQDMWVKLCNLIGQPALAAHPDFADNNARMAHREALKARLNESFAARSRLDWTRDLVELGLPAGPIFDVGEALSDPHVLHNGLVEEIAHPLLGKLKQLADPIRLESMGGRSVRTPPPQLGEHSESALADYGIDRSRIAALVADGTVKQI